jgi:hypothetical protein
MAFDAVGFGGLAERLCAVVADAAMLIRAMHILRHLQIFLFHFENFGMAISAFGLVLVYMGFMAEQNGAGAPLGLKFNVPAARFFLLGRGDAECREAQDADADQEGLPDSFPQNFSPLFVRWLFAFGPIPTILFINKFITRQKGPSREKFFGGGQET